MYLTFCLSAHQVSAVLYSIAATAQAIKDALPDWKAGDLDQNEKLNACDLTLLKQLLMK